MHKITLLLLFLGSIHFVFAQNYSIPHPDVDILHYRFELTIGDETDEIKGRTTVQVRITDPKMKAFSLELVNKQGEKGMTVTSVSSKGKPISFSHKSDKITLTRPNPTVVDTQSYVIEYHGIPTDGLIIAKNIFGDRTFFGDNWPNRIHHWLPTVDHPADKAYCEFIVTAPNHYQVVANGRLIEETDLPEAKRLTHWKTDIKLPTKVMVFGAARFAIQYLEPYKGVSVSSWVYPQNRKEGFYDYALARQVLAFMETHIGPYPYSKLANVQSKTRYGGMENAGNIFYAESSITGNRTSEALLAHEIAHQWFGNSASEANWFHIWLSEGFATYFAALYFEGTYGKEVFHRKMIDHRKTIILAGPAKPLVDPSVKDLNQLLNANSYDKGAFVLHMLRHRIGDTPFWKGIRIYYQEFRFSNALTEDLQQVMEEVSGDDLTDFFQQWVYRTGHPYLEGSWKYDATKKELLVTIRQTQKGEPFVFPLDIGIQMGNDSPFMIETKEVDAGEHTFTFPLESEPIRVELDPKVWLLMEGGIERG